MKTSKIIAAFSMMLLFYSLPVLSQEQEPARPQFITVTTIHWNMDYENFDMDTWKAVEQEYFDKVTSKNELIMSSGYYTHRFTPDNRELLAVNAYSNWENINKANDRNQELVEAGWPDKEARTAFFKKRNAYYADFHVDEIYTPLENGIIHDRKSAPILLVRKSYLKFPGAGETWDDLTAHLKEVSENIFQKNENIKGYYPNRHIWGSDSTEFIQAFFVNSMADLDALFDRNSELFEAHWPDEAAQKKVQDLRSRYFTGVHGDYIYTVVSELIK